MLNVLRKERFTEIMLKHFIFVSLFFPIYSSSYESAYAPDFIFANVFAFLVVVGILVQKKGTFREHKVWLCMLLLLICYNASAFYVNWKQLGWYESQLNITIPFLFFLTLVSLGSADPERDSSVLSFFLKAVVISNCIGIVVYLFHYDGVGFMNLSLKLIPTDPNFYERRFNWIYLHKSQYAFNLVLFLALMVTYRGYFRKRWMYYAGIGVMAIGLVISHTYTSMAAALLIFAGQFVDHLLSKDGKLQPKKLLWLLPVLALAVVLFQVVSTSRNISTLGGRIPIWQGGIDIIRENPYGIGQVCGGILYTVPGLSFGIYNLHNVFLNLLLQFSIPAGLCCIAMIGFILLVSIKRNLSFTTLGIWAALLIPMMMDWCLLLMELPMFLMGLYFLFFSPIRNRKPAEAVSV